MRIMQVIVVAEISQIDLRTSNSIYIFNAFDNRPRQWTPSDGNRSTATIGYKGCNINRLINSTSLTFLNLIWHVKSRCVCKVQKFSECLGHCLPLEPIQSGENPFISTNCTSINCLSSLEGHLNAPFSWFWFHHFLMDSWNDRFFIVYMKFSKCAPTFSCLFNNGWSICGCHVF